MARYVGAMTSALNLARLAAVVAIFGFFLPWAEVSCSGQPLAHETGIQLITGDGPGAPAPAHHDLWVACSLGFIVLGLAGGLLARGQRGAVILMAAALAAAVASLIGVSQEVPSAEVHAQLAEGPPGGDASARQAAGELMSANLEYGDFVTLGGLIVAIAGAGLALAGQRSPRGEPG
ncbi:MAG TPA: hypothetical protein VN814_15450 [Caulobacteraceae bacterium]|nr:hypothetical protein [Caulobacteraceae bacterium]